jgi:hypothetical protein
LRHISVLEFDNVPNLTKVLEVLEIEGTNGCDFAIIYDPQDFKDRLRKCTNLREFRWAACVEDNLDTDMASYLPPSLEKLRYGCLLPFLHHFDDWIKHSSDQTWLPFKSFQLTVDPEIRVKSPLQEFFPEAFDAEFEEKRRVLYRMLKANRPFVDLLT